jgi:putative ABC transport system permease protein
MPTLASIDLAEGRYFTVHEDHYASRVAVLGPDVSDALIRTGDPLGSSIRVGGLIYTVIGVAERRGKSLGASQDNYIVIPLLTFQRTYGSSASLTIYEKAYPLDVGLADASDEAQLLMRRIRRDTLGADNSFTVETNNTLIALMRRLAQLFAAVAVPIACTSLIVGGVVTMNMMLVSVTERTKEIGLRKALGARRSSIQLQFLIESSVMALAGGTLGVMIGIGVGSAISNYAGFPMRPAWWSIFAGLLMSTIIGLTFGVYPARRAAMLDPIEAMGRE